MSVLTTQQLSAYYESYRDIELTFTRSVVRALALRAAEIHLKVGGEQWPCIPYSASMSRARVIVQMQPLYFDDLEEAKNLASLRWAFDTADDRDALYFFGATRVTGFSPYESAGQDFHFLDLEFTQKPPDDFIEIIGALPDGNANSQNRAEDRVVITPATADAIGLRGKEVMVEIEGAARKAILRDLSISGAKVLVAGIGGELMNKPITLRLDLFGVGVVPLPGSVIRFEDVEGRDDIAALAMDFDADRVPPDYKLRFNQLLRQQR